MASIARLDGGDFRTVPRLFYDSGRPQGVIPNPWADGCEYIVSIFSDTPRVATWQEIGKGRTRPRKSPTWRRKRQQAVRKAASASPHSAGQARSMAPRGWSGTFHPRIARGRHHGGAIACALDAFIPAYAGQTAGSQRATLSTVFHPRIRRAHAVPYDRDRRPRLSSPRSAGHTTARCLRPSHGSFHPRIRGAHLSPMSSPFPTTLSSPHTRGTRWRYARKS